MDAFGRPSVFRRRDSDDAWLASPHVMDLQQFTLSTSGDSPPQGLSPALQALWHLRKGDWQRAHAIVQEHDDERAYALVHAHLHRIEGDLANARYWYRRASAAASESALEDEWKALAVRFLENDD